MSEKIQPEDITPEDEKTNRILSQKLTNVMGMLARVFNVNGRRYAIALVVFGRARIMYASSAKREEVIGCYKDLVKRWETQDHIDLPYHIVPKINEDDEDILQTPIGPKKWGTIRKALEQYKE